MRPELTRRLARDAAAPYRGEGRASYYWAQGKLRFDPMFAALLELELLAPGAHVLDLGCGRSLLAAWFLAAERLAREGDWTGEREPPAGLRFRGVEIAADDAECGRRALGPLYGARIAVESADLRSVQVGGSDVVMLLDVLHYMPFDDQERVLDRIREGLGRAGVLIVRVGDGGAGLRSGLASLTDRLVLLARARRTPQLSCRRLTEWIATLRARELAVNVHPMSAGTPFANALLVARPRS